MPMLCELQAGDVVQIGGFRGEIFPRKLTDASPHVRIRVIGDWCAEYDPTTSPDVWWRKTSLHELIESKTPGQCFSWDPRTDADLLAIDGWTKDLTGILKARVTNIVSRKQDIVYVMDSIVWLVNPDLKTLNQKASAAVMAEKKAVPTPIYKLKVDQPFTFCNSKDGTLYYVPEHEARRVGDRIEAKVTRKDGGHWCIWVDWNTLVLPVDTSTDYRDP